MAQTHCVSVMRFTMEYKLPATHKVPRRRSLIRPIDANALLIQMLAVERLHVRWFDAAFLLWPMLSVIPI